MNFFTIANHKYFPQALCLIESIRKFYCNSKIFLINTDDFLDKEVFFYKKKYNFEVVNIKNIQIKYLYPSHVERPDFVLEENIKFGMGTTYEGGIYHAFESRFTKNDYFFINKCLEILK